MLRDRTVQKPVEVHPAHPHRLARRRHIQEWSRLRTRPVISDRDGVTFGNGILENEADIRKCPTQPLDLRLNAGSTGRLSGTRSMIYEIARNELLEDREVAIVQFLIEKSLNDERVRAPH